MNCPRPICQAPPTVEAQRRQNVEQPGLITGLSSGNAIGATWAKSHTSVIEYRFVVTRLGMDHLPESAGGPSLRELFGITGLPEGSRIQGGITPQDITGFSRIGRQSTNPQAQFPTTINSRLNMTKLLGPHSLKFGYEFLWLGIVVDDTNPRYGRYQIATQLEASTRQQAHWDYIQDEWKVNSKLTLNMRLRYEITSPMFTADDRLANFAPASNQLVVAKGGSWSDRALRDLDTNNFAPRLGASYRASKRLVFRRGYGLGCN